jgi:DHA1 family chloramphenicol resistance protein-like MFS transporter
MVEHRSSPILLLVLLSAAVFLVRTVWLMLGPLLVELAAEFHTSVAVTGQLVAVIGLSWGITAPLVGPVSDTYGRRRVGLTGLLLMAIGTLGSVFAWSYGALLACRLLTGVGAAMIPPNSIAAIADHFPPAQRGTPISVLISASFLGVVIGTPLVALLGEVGGWRLPFYGVGALLIAVWGMQWRWFPQSTREAAPSFAFIAHFREASRSTGMWYVLVANVLYQIAALGIFTYLAAILRHTYGMTAGETVVPLALVGIGAMVGSLIGGRVAGHRRRLVLATTALFVGGVTGGMAFIVTATPWGTILLACASVLLLTIFEPVTWTLTAEFAGESRATANGLLATSNQLGVIGGASAGGLVLALGGFSLVGVFCLGAATAAAVVVIGLKMRGAQEFRMRVEGA